MFIYKITNKINGKIYVGKTEQTLLQRWNRHLQDVGKKNRPLYNAIAKHGPEFFVMEVVEECKSKEDLSIREIFWIASLKSTIVDGNYNLHPGGGGGYTTALWEESRRKELYRQQAEKRRGRSPSKETREKQRCKAKQRFALLSFDVKERIREHNSHSMKEQYRTGTRKIQTPKRYGTDHPRYISIDIPFVLEQIKNCWTLKQLAVYYSCCSPTIGGRIKNETGKTFIEWRREYGIVGKLSQPRLE